jgi:hypothetical protein
MPSLEFRGKPSDNWLVVSSRLCGRCYGPGVWLLHPCFQFLSGQLEALYDSDLPLSLTFSPFGFCQPRLYPSYHCHHLHIIIHVSLIHVLTWCPLLFRFIICLLCHVVLFAFWLATFRVTLIYSPLPFELVRCLLYHPPSPTLFMLTSSYSFTHVAHVYVYVSFLPLSRFDRHPPSSLLLTSLPYAFYSSVLSIIVVFHTTHTRMFPFLLRNPSLLIFSSLHTLPLRLLRLTGGVRIPRLSFSLIETYCIRTYNQPPAYHSHADLS